MKLFKQKSAKAFVVKYLNKILPAQCHEEVSIEIKFEGNKLWMFEYFN